MTNTVVYKFLPFSELPKYEHLIHDSRNMIALRRKGYCSPDCIEIYSFFGIYYFFKKGTVEEEFEDFAVGEYRLDDSIQEPAKLADQCKALEQLVQSKIESIDTILKERDEWIEKYKNLEQSKNTLRLRPMSEAPRDGTTILAKKNNNAWCIVFRKSDQEYPWHMPYHSMGERGSFEIDSLKLIGWPPLDALPTSLEE